MFEITPDNIALLNDEKLREVVARLCEAEVRRRGFSSSCVTWGGDQNAADGGIDVRVTLPPGSPIGGFLPRAEVGFQVKRQDMPRAKILAEMSPNGLAKPSIQRLAARSGAYIIVSSQGSTSDLALRGRRDAMSDAMGGVSDGDALALDFYDRTRIATWVRDHVGLIPWIRTLVEKAVPGWHSYGSWACAPIPVTAEYLLDEEFRVHAIKRATEKGLSALEGIRQMRDELREPRRIVRLVGLSGVGKTRLVQALFDERVGERGLDPSLAIYTNMVDEPDPHPIALASGLVAAATRAILVVDNCPSELHQRLSELCRCPDGMVSVITIEYDIREDEPEGTAVFTLESSSPELVEKLLRLRFRDISQIDARAIAGFSGGNARIAIALAGTIGRSGSVAGLTDEQLFRRLFLQRHTPDESLYLAAQACSLVYSFQGEDVSDADAGELVRLGSIIGRTPQELFRSIAEMKRRDLVQQRGVWRAVLPHAIANRLAATALQNVPYAEIERHFAAASSRRLLRSFSRRLGYLHDSREAVTIVRNWLGASGLLGNVASLDGLGRAMLENVAPVAPEDVLAALERALLRPQGEETAKGCKSYLDLLRSLAYEIALFERCIELIVRIVAADDVNQRTHGTELFVSLFHLKLSGTHATIEQRLNVIKVLLASPEGNRRSLGVLALKAVLEAWQFHSASSFHFGARSRDYGYWPRTSEEVRHWFGETLELVASLACSEGRAAGDAREALAEKFRGLWHRAGVPDELANVCRAIGAIRFWPDGWHAIRETLALDVNEMECKSLEKLRKLDVALRPTSLLEKVRSAVFSTRLQGVDFDDFDDRRTEDYGRRREQTEALARELGRAVAGDETVLDEVLPEAVASDGFLWSFGQGLLEGTTDAEDLWSRMVSALTATEESLRKPQVLMGFLQGLNATSPALAASLLDDAVEHETLARCYPFLQVAVEIYPPDVVRLKRSLAVGKAPAAMYAHLSSSRATDPIAAGDLRDLVLAIAAIPFGHAVAIDILYMRLHSDRDRTEGAAPELIDAGCELMQQVEFKKKNDREDYQLGAIGTSCLVGAKGAVITNEVLRRLKAAVAKYETSAIHNDDLLDALFSAQPDAALEGLCGGDAKDLEQGIGILRDVGLRKQPLSLVPDEDLLQWCDQEPQTRYLALAEVIGFCRRTSDDGPPQWTSVALQFLKKAPSAVGVLHKFCARFMPSSGWSGSLVVILESNVTLLDRLGAYPALNAAAAREKERLKQWIEDQKCRETASEKQLDERFE